MIQVGMCIQRRFKSTGACAQSDQSLSLPSEEMLDRVPIEDSDQSARMRRLIESSMDAHAYLHNWTYCCTSAHSI